MSNDQYKNPNGPISDEDRAFSHDTNKWCAPFAVMFFGLFALLLLMYGIDVNNPQDTNTSPEYASIDMDKCDLDWTDFLVSKQNALETVETVDVASWPHAPISSDVARANPTNLLQSGIRYADHYVIIKDSESASIVDAKTGKIIAYNLTTTGGISVHPDSTLMQINIGEKGPFGYDVAGEYSVDYYRINNDKLELLCSRSQQQVPEGACRERPLTIVSNATRERLTVPTDCDMPSQNWMAAFGKQTTDTSYWEVSKTN